MLLPLARLGWLIIAEIFPTRIRARAMGLASLCVWLAAYHRQPTDPSDVRVFRNDFRQS